jgi:hypothetical protein
MKNKQPQSTTPGPQPSQSAPPASGQSGNPDPSHEDHASTAAGGIIDKAENLFRKGERLVGAVEKAEPAIEEAEQAIENARSESDESS